MERGRIEIFQSVESMMDDIEGFSHVGEINIYHELGEHRVNIAAENLINYLRDLVLETEEQRSGMEDGFTIEDLHSISDLANEEVGDNELVSKLQELIFSSSQRQRKMEKVKIEDWVVGDLVHNIERFPDARRFAVYEENGEYRIDLAFATLQGYIRNLLLERKNCRFYSEQDFEVDEMSRIYNLLYDAKDNELLVKIERMIVNRLRRKILTLR